MKYNRERLNQREEELNSRAHRRMNKLWLTLRNLLLISVIGLAALVICIGLGAFRAILDTAPDISNINVTPTGYSTFVYDAKGTQIAKLVGTDANRIPVTMDMVPDDLKHAFVAIEDERFYDHYGIDIQGIFRAAFVGLTSGNFSEGASTITQQLLKNNVFTGWTQENFAESVRRKIQEQYLAVELEKHMSKDDILINYMNTINLGHNTLGVQAASLRYFGKSVSALNLSECAAIAGITQNPSWFDPIVYPEKNAERRKEVLNRMLKQGWIDQARYDEAMADDVYSRIQIVDNETDDNQINSYFVDALQEQLLEDLVRKGYTEPQAYTLLFSGGLKIYATQDPVIQAICDEVVEDPNNYPFGTRWYLTYSLSLQGTDGTVRNYSTQMLETYFRENNRAFTLIFNTQEEAQAKAEEYKNAVMQEGDEILGERVTLTPQPEISLTISDQKTGYVVAMVGGRGDKTANRTLNRAYDVMRQPGSTFKVVAAYAPALDAGGFTLATTLVDEPYTYEDGTPVRNWYGESYRGLSTVRQGIQSSMNILAVKTLTEITPEVGYQYLQDFGFTTLVDDYETNGQIFSDIQQTLALGGITLGVKNVELNAAYACIANGGMYLEPKLYSLVTDHDGNVILDSEDQRTRRVLKETTAWLLTSAMEDVVTKGTGTMVNFGTTAIAGKTGTTSDENDVWFSGYTNYYTCTTWAGYDENTDLVGAESNIAKLIWRGVMEKVHATLELPAAKFEPPEGIVQETVCKLSGKHPNAGCAGYQVTEYFDADTVPIENCDIHYQGMICSLTGLPASSDCPFQQQGYATFNRSGMRCPHTAEYMSQDNIEQILAQEKEQLRQRQEAAKRAADLENAKAALDDANAKVDEAMATLAAAQAMLEQANASGDPEAITTWTIAVGQATTAYEDAVVNQAIAEAAKAELEGGGGGAAPAPDAAGAGE